MTNSIRPEFPQVLDSSMRGTFSSCPRKFYNAYILGLSPKRLSIHLHFGACFAAGLEEFRRSFYGGERDATQSLYLGFLRIIREWGDYPLDDEEPKTFYRCLAALDYYLSVHLPGTDIVQPFIKDDGTPAVEFSFTLPLDHKHPETGEPLIYAGRFDMLGVYDNTSLVIVDEKTTKQLGPSWSSSWDLRAQFMGYAYAAHSFGYPVIGALVRGIAFRTTGFDHADALVLTYDWSLDRWWNQLNRDISRMLQSWEEGYWDYDLDSACSSYGGCSFAKLCRVKDETPWIQEEYTVRRWNPLHLDPLQESRQKELPLLEIL